MFIKTVVSLFVSLLFFGTGCRTELYTKRFTVFKEERKLPTPDDVGFDFNTVEVTNSQADSLRIILLDSLKVYDKFLFEGIAKEQYWFFLDENKNLWACFQFMHGVKWRKNLRDAPFFGKQIFLTNGHYGFVTLFFNYNTGAFGSPTTNEWIRY